MDLALSLLSKPYYDDLHVDNASGLVLSGGHLLFLGRHYRIPLDEPIEYLQDLADARNPERRFSLYAYLLEREVDRTDIPETVHVDVMAERDAWFDWYGRSLEAAHLHVDRPGSLLYYAQYSSGFHIIWQGKTPRGNALPSMNIWGMHDLPVHRVLRMTHLPLDPIPDGRHATRNTDLCREEFCVYPAHMQCKPHNAPLPVAGYRGLRKLSGLHPKQVSYYEVQGQFYCRPRHHPVPPPRMTRDGKLQRTVYCAACYKLRSQAGEPTPDVQDVESITSSAMSMFPVSEGQPDD